MNKDSIIECLQLQPHPLEGGFFSRTYESELRINIDGQPRLMATSIYYLLTDDSPIGYMHRNKSDIVHYFHCGSAIKYTVVTPEGEVSTAVLGNNLERGERPQLTVRGYCWKIAELQGGEFGLLSEAVVPGFEYSDNDIATRGQIAQLFPQHIEVFKKYIAD